MQPAGMQNGSSDGYRAKADDDAAPGAGASSAPPARSDYTQPPPGGTHYPWEPGGGSKVPGVPDNWRDFYPNEQEGRGDAWIGPKKAQLNAEHPPSSYQGMPSARDRFAGDPQGFAKWQQSQLPQDAAQKANLAKMHDYSDTGPVAQGSPASTTGSAAAGRRAPIRRRSYSRSKASSRGRSPTSAALQAAAAPTRAATRSPSRKARREACCRPDAGSAQQAVRRDEARREAHDRRHDLLQEPERRGGRRHQPRGAQAHHRPSRQAHRAGSRATGDDHHRARRPATTPPGRVPIGSQPPPTTPGGNVQRPVDHAAPAATRATRI